MVCYYVEICRKCGGGKKWLCMAAIPPKRVKERKVCLDPVASECTLYEMMVERHGVKERVDGI